MYLIAVLYEKAGTAELSNERILVFTKFGNLLISIISVFYIVLI